MKPPSLIVPAQVKDLPQMADLAHQFYRSSAMLRRFEIGRFVELWTRLIGSGTGAIFMLMDRDGMQGVIGGVFHPDIYSGELLAQEFFWFVGEQYRGAGVRLYRRFEEWAREMGCKEIRMVHLVDSMPEKVAHFYQRVGYSKVETAYSKRLEVAELRRAG